MRVLTTFLFLFLSFHSFSQETVVLVKKDSISTGKDSIIVDELPIQIVETVPAFPGCTGSNNEMKYCFNMKMRKHVAKNFNVDKASCVKRGMVPNKETNEMEEGCIEELPAGSRVKIYARFRINKKGEIDQLDIQAPSDELRKETKRILGKLPVFKPGTQRGKPVNVRYVLPIIFSVN